MSTISSPTSARRSASASCTMPSGSHAPEPSASLWAGTPKRITPGMPRAASSLTSLRSDSRVCCTTPGRLAIGCGSVMPSRTNSGATRSSTVTRVSATRRRSAGVRRSRRSRRWGKATASGYRRAGFRSPGRRGRRAAATVRSATESTTRSACAKSLNRVMRLGTATAVIPAALADGDPVGRVLQRDGAGGIGAEVGAGAEVHVGRRLADPADEVGSDHRTEPRSEPQPPEVTVEPLERGRRGHADRDALRPPGCRRAPRCPGGAGASRGSSEVCCA